VLYICLRAFNDVICCPPFDTRAFYDVISGAPVVRASCCSLPLLLIQASKSVVRINLSTPPAILTLDSVSERNTHCFVHLLYLSHILSLYINIPPDKMVSVDFRTEEKAVEPF
jgi:hypothetical protein